MFKKQKVNKIVLAKLYKMQSHISVSVHPPHEVKNSPYGEGEIREWERHNKRVGKEQQVSHLEAGMEQ